MRDYIKYPQPQLPAGIQITPWSDWSPYLKARLGMLLEDALISFLIVYAILLLFLRAQLALWTGLDIAVAFMGAMWLMPYLGLSLNVFTLTAFILVLGIVVDDAIVIAENIYDHQDRGIPPLKAALKGTREMAPLVILMVLMPVIALLPALFLPGAGGRLLFGVATVIILALLFSLADALLILPAHLASGPGWASSSLERWKGCRKVQGLAQQGLQNFIERVYLPLLDHCLRWRYAVLASSVALVPQAIQPSVTDYYVFAPLTTPAGTPFAEARRQILQIEQAINDLRAEWAAQGDDPVRYVRTFLRGNRGHVLLELKDAARDLVPELVKQWREKVGPPLPGTELNFIYTFPFNVGMQEGPVPKDIEFELTALDLDTLQAGGEALRAWLARIPGVHSLGVSLKPGEPQVRLTLKPEARFLGLTQRQLAEQVRQAFYGLEAQRFLRDGEEVKVMVRYPESERRSLDDLKNLPISLPKGGEVPLKAVAELQYQEGFASIIRHNGERVQQVSAEVNSAVVQADKVVSQAKRTIIPELEARYPGLKVRPGALRREQGEAVFQLVRNALFALLVIYGLLAVVLKSYAQPLMVLSAVPFGFVGAIWAHYFLEMPMTLGSLVVLVALAGLVVNTSLVMVDYINHQRQGDREIMTVVKEAGARRFRPIMLTALTTVLGLAPILLEEGVAADYIKPLTVPLAFGVAFSTLVTLFLVPLCYAALEDLRGVSRLGRGRGKAATPLTALPASPEGREKGADDLSEESGEVRSLPGRAGKPGRDKI